MVSPSKNIYKCFGCGKGGDAVKFVMEKENKSFPEAIRALAAKLHITITEAEQTPEQKKQQDERERMIAFNEFALKFFRANLSGDALSYVQNRMNTESIELFEIGFAPDSYDMLAKHAIANFAADADFLLNTGLIKQNDKSKDLYDFFRNRIIFPIRDHTGRLISFTGRVLPGADEKYAKYINLPDTAVYSKSRVLYGMHTAARGIRTDNRAVLVEGNTDVINMQQLGYVGTVAACGTSLTDEQLKLIKRHTTNLLMMMDGDDAGQKAALRNSKMAVEQGFFVSLVRLEQTMDPADFNDKDKLDAFINEQKTDFIIWYAALLNEKAGEDPSLKNEAVKEIAHLLSFYEASIRELYVDQITGKGKIKTKLLRDKLSEIDRANAKPDKTEKADYHLPPGVDASDYDRYGFYEHKNEYHFRTNGKPDRLSNFVMRPLFHINSIFESKRIYEIENSSGYRIVVNLDMKEMTSLQAFAQNVEGKGNFLFWGNPAQFNRLKLKLYEQTKTCADITSLGWQKEGFWAWSNGIIANSEFVEVDEYGLIKFNENYYFIPAFSQIYINDKSIFIDERKFKFRKREITLDQWCGMFISVFGNNAIVAIAYWVATLFRDHLLHIFHNFPILNLFGPKGTGKSQMAKSMMYLFGDAQTAFNIHNGTKPGLAEHMQQFCNAFAWVDEYKNSLEYDKIETLKSIYDAIGRSRMNMDKGKKKETTNVNSAVILSGQEMPTADIALFSRVLFLRFTQTEFSDQEKDRYDKLKKLESEGLSHLSTELIIHRDFFVKEFYDVYQETLLDFNKHFADNQVEDRIMRSMLAIVASWRTIARVVKDFPFDYNTLLGIALESIEVQNAQISQSNELGMFWNLLESLFDENLIIDKWHFRVDFTNELKTKSATRNFDPAKNVLKFKYNTIYSLYAQQARRQGLKAMPSDTLMYYLVNHKTFLGIQSACVFTHNVFDTERKEYIKKKQNTSAFCFDYDKLKINLVREDESLNPYDQAQMKINGHHMEEDKVFKPITVKEPPF
jgi:DNA primase catalytic core